MVLYLREPTALHGLSKREQFHNQSRYLLSLSPPMYQQCARMKEDTVCLLAICIPPPTVEGILVSIRNIACSRQLKDQSHLVISETKQWNNQICYFENGFQMNSHHTT
ncbi:hypothetical protein EMCG_05710 [[Emmonsia] crescens]|uniref:Uncharacterized protein n=1 Tax=[Emmonsia] crescens TaxID=73230 RepID=A0A0G2IEC1_9EURO|nr:hypothetical protein EMCG_05710 [Emmonsia crescens UAMH 3008]